MFVQLAQDVSASDPNYVAAVTILISVGSLIVAVVAIMKAASAHKEALKLDQAQIRLHEGQVENEVRSAIVVAKHRYEDVVLQCLPAVLSDPVKEIKETALSTIESAEEGYRNSYEAACERYYDKKIDQERFKKSYSRGIQEVVEKPQWRDLYTQVGTEPPGIVFCH